MNNEAPTVTPVDSVPANPTPIDFSAMSDDQRKSWRETGNLPSADSAPAAKEEKKEAVPDSAPEKKEEAKSTDAAASEAAKESQEKGKRQHPPKTPETTEKRITELLDDNRKLKEKLAALEAPKTQTSAPAPKNEFVKLDPEKWFKENPGKTYEDFIDAAADHRAQWLLNERDRKAAEQATQKDVQEKFSKLKERYPDADRIFPTVNQIMSDAQIPDAVKAAVSRSPQMEHLLYALSGDEATVNHFIQTAKSDPLQAVRVIFQMEQDIKSELEKGGSGKEKAEAEPDKKETPRDGDGKFTKAPERPISNAPKPTTEIGGHATSPTDPEEAAVRNGDYRAMSAAMTKKYQATRTA